MTREQKKVQRWTEREARRKLTTMIIDDGHGGFMAFNKYYLRPQTNQVQVTVNNQDTVMQFSNKRTAISWCVADNYQHHKLAQIIQTLDDKKQVLLSDIRTGQQTVDRSGNAVFRELVTTKLERKSGLYDMVLSELEKCLNLAKYIQLKGFQNETARTSGR